MDKVKSVAKSGWHPTGKDGKKESWRGEFKQVAGRVSKGKNPETKASEHQSRPIATLKNPDAFGPPPKNVNYHGGVTVPNSITPDRSGFGVPLNNDEIRVREEEEQQEVLAAEEAAMRRGPPLPYRVDTTGLSTNNLPKPPIRRLGNQNVLGTPSANSIVKAKPKPSLPPRLPPRQGSPALQEHASPPPPYSASPQQAASSDNMINQGALKRLGSAGISVPGFGIGGGSEGPKPWRDHRSIHNATATSDETVDQNSQMSELQSRFSKISTKSPTAETPTQGTTFAQKQTALKTASSFRNDPSSVSLADAKTTVYTANNFRERHGDQVADGWKKGSALNKKYSLMDKFNSHVSDGTQSTQNEGALPTVTSDMNGQSLPSSTRKPPPPPPPKRLGSSASSPPPIPLASKPR